MCQQPDLAKGGKGYEEAQPDQPGLNHPVIGQGRESFQRRDVHHFAAKRKSHPAKLRVARKEKKRRSEMMTTLEAANG